MREAIRNKPLESRGNVTSARHALPDLVRRRRPTAEAPAAQASSAHQPENRPEHPRTLLSFAKTARIPAPPLRQHSGRLTNSMTGFAPKDLSGKDAILMQTRHIGVAGFAGAPFGRPLPGVRHGGRQRPLPAAGNREPTTTGANPRGSPGLRGRRGVRTGAWPVPPAPADRSRRGSRPAWGRPPGPCATGRRAGGPPASARGARRPAGRGGSPP